MALFSGFFKGNQGKRVTETANTRTSTLSELRLSYQAANIQMIGTRDSQEDSFAIINATDVTEMIHNGLFAVVADGMGGMTQGKLVSETAVYELVEIFRAIDRKGDIPEQLLEGIHSVNKRLCKKFAGAGGTTIVLALIYQEALYWAGVGDSAIYLKRDGGVFLLNKEHTYRNELYLKQLRMDTLNKQLVENDTDGTRLSAFMGMDGMDEVDHNIRPLKLQCDDVLLLCSDGISGVLEENEINDALSRTPSDACAWLNEAVMKKQNPFQDNYTGLIIACKR